MRLALVAFAVLTLLVHGYHPYAEDGGLYVAGVEYTLQPTLFPHDTAFVTEHLSYSVFAPLLAGAVRCTHLPLSVILLLAYAASLLLSFFSAHQLLRRCVAGPWAPQWIQLGGLALLAAWWTLPIAGTSLMLMDPYVTARSFSTPLSLLAIAFALDPWKTRVAHSWHGFWHHEWGSTTACACALILAALFHPLMAVYALAFVITICLTRLRHRALAWSLLTLAALALAAALQAFAPTESAAVVAASYSRYYWFLSQWQWFELLGLFGPIAILAALLHWRRRHLTEAATTLLRAALALGTIAVLIALLFAHESYRTHLVARLQPMRVFLLLYAVMTLLLGATLAQLIRNIALRALLLLALCATMFFVQRNIYPVSPHIELPGRQARNTNPWVQAFLWSRTHTPPDAVFALDAKYVNEDGEDAQTFRAWALRSALPDFSKDGGEAAIAPELAPRWLTAATAQRGLSTEDDRTRDARILPLGATWMVVHATAPTRHPCPYNNGFIKVCQLTP
jgi:MFS family permease